MLEVENRVQDILALYSSFKPSFYREKRESRRSGSGEKKE